MLACCPSFPAFGAEMCAREELKNFSASDARCYFYAGTAAYRDKNFKLAAENWKKLIALKGIPIELEYLRVDAYNNLGFLYFYGKETSPNKKLAVEYWTYAMNAGHEESTYHLCQVYGDSEQPTYNAKLARGYCREGLRRYESLKETGSQIDEIVRQMKETLSRLEG